MPTNSDNYSTIIDSVNDVREALSGAPKSYPSNYAGIIAALKDLGTLGIPGTGDTPPGWSPTYDENGNIIGGSYDQLPNNGQLWFDTRQGRLFIYRDGDWYQANGADGLTIVGSTIPPREVIGGTWYNTSNNSYYIYDGTTWSIIGGATAYSTDALALANPTTARYNNTDNYLPAIGVMVTQADANNYYYDALRALDDELFTTNTNLSNIREDRVPTIAVSAPANPIEGDFWYGTETGVLSIYSGTQWETTYELTAADLASVEADITALEGSVATAQASIAALESAPEKTYTLGTFLGTGTESITPGIVLKDQDDGVTSCTFSAGSGIDVTESATGIIVAAPTLVAAIDAIEADYLTSTDSAGFNSSIGTNSTAIQTLTQVNNTQDTRLSALETTASTLAQASDLASRLHTDGGSLYGNLCLCNNRITDLAAPVDANDAARKVDIDALQTAIDQTYFRKDGGTLTSVVLENSDLNEPTFDFSGQNAYSTKAFKMKTNGSNDTAMFGTNSNLFEYAWEFSGNEDWVWSHTTGGKSASINKDGIATKQLLLGDLAANDSTGRVISNPVNVGSLLSTHTAQIHNLETELATAPTRFYYQDTAPITGVNNGNLWFDTVNIRLLVRHSGAWINADRVEDSTLKTDLRNAVNNSTDYASLKSALLSVLS